MKGTCAVHARVYGQGSQATRLHVLAVRAGDRAIRRQSAYLTAMDDVGRLRRLVQQATSLAGRLNAARSSEEARIALQRHGRDGRRSVLV